MALALLSGHCGRRGVIGRGLGYTELLIHWPLLTLILRVSPSPVQAELPEDSAAHPGSYVNLVHCAGLQAAHTPDAEPAAVAGHHRLPGFSYF